MKAIKLLVFGLLLTGTLSAQKSDSYSFKDLDMVFYNAYGAYLDGDDEETADQLEDAADWLKDFGKTFDDETIEDRYKDYAKMLNSLADAVERGDIMDDGQLRYAFAKIHHDIADIYGMQADTYFAANDMKNTGNALNYTAGHLSRAGMWSGTTTYGARSNGTMGNTALPGENTMTDGNGNRIVDGTKSVARTGGKVVKGTAKTGAKVVEGTAKTAYKAGKGVTKTAYKGAKGIAKGTARGIGWIGRKLFGGDKVDDDELKETMDYQKQERDNMKKNMERDTDVSSGVHPSIYEVGTNY